MSAAFDAWGRAAARPWRPSVVLTLALSVAVALALRHFAIEPPAIGHACDVARWQGWCAARTTLLMTFQHQQLGWIALVLGVLALWTRRAAIGHAGLVFGCLGIVLYSYDTAALGLLASLLALCRPAR
ncbi:MAG: hypothetical protein QM766_09335 [Burkholderiaceae bacterium]